MKHILAFPLPIDSDNPLVVRGIVRFEGDVFNEPNPDPLITYIDVADDVEVELNYIVTKNEDNTYTFTKP
jgi:hypothetical protein